jgi:hypothetical protein
MSNREGWQEQYQMKTKRTFEFLGRLQAARIDFDSYSGNRDSAVCQHHIVISQGLGYPNWKISCSTWHRPTEEK